MSHNAKRAVAALLMLLCIGFAGMAQVKGEIISIPGFGDVGVTKNGKTYTVALKDWGTWEFTGSYKSSKDFDLTTSLPAGSFTDYIPGAGQLLSVLGLDTVDLRLTPKGLGIGINLASGGLGALRGVVTEALSSVASLGPVIDDLISTLEIKSFGLNGSVISKKLSGTMKGEVALLGKTFTFSKDGEIGVNALLDSLSKQIVDVSKDYVAKYAKVAYEKSRKAVASVGKSGLAKADKAWDAVAAKTREAMKTIDYATNSWDKNLSSDLPRLVAAKGDPMVVEGRRVMDELYAELLPLVRNLPAPDKELALADAFMGVTAGFEERWRSIFFDNVTDSWTVIDKRENELRSRYRDGILKLWKSERRYRYDQYLRLVSSAPLVRIKRSPADALANLRFYAKYSVPLTIETKGEFLAVSLMTGETKGANGSGIRFKESSGGNNQQWILVDAGAPDTYHIKSTYNGRFIHISGAKDEKGSPLVIYDGAGAPQTTFKASADGSGFVRFFTKKGLSFDLFGGVAVSNAVLGVYDNFNGECQAFYVMPFVPGQARPFYRSSDTHNLTMLAATQIPAVITAQGGGFAWDLMMGDNGGANGNGITFYATHSLENQQWYLVAAAGQPGSYHFRSAANGRYIHISGANDAKQSSLAIWDGCGAPQTTFKARIFGQYVTFITQKGFALDLCGGKPQNGAVLWLWDDAGLEGQRFSVKPQY